MNGKMNAIGLTLLMIASALAGCTSGDPDGDGEMGIDADLLDQLIQDNLQDFINNTTVTVVNNHYSNDSNEVTNHINSSSVDSTSRIMTGAIEGYNMFDNISWENNHVLLVRGDRYSPANGSNSNVSDSPHSWDEVNLDGANICVRIGSIEESKLSNWLGNLGSSFTSVPVADYGEANSKFIDGSCDAMEGMQGAMETKKTIWDIDGTMNGVEIWITAPMGQYGELYAIESRVDFTLEQEYGTSIGFPYVYTEISVEGHCMENCESEDLPLYETFVIYGNDVNYFSECQIPEYGLISQNDPYFLLPGLNCSLTISLHAYVEFEKDNYEYVWSDWAYYIAWTESEVNMED